MYYNNNLLHHATFTSSFTGPNYHHQKTNKRWLKTTLALNDCSFSHICCLPSLGPSSPLIFFISWCWASVTAVATGLPLLLLPLSFCYFCCHCTWPEFQVLTELQTTGLAGWRNTDFTIRKQPKTTTADRQITHTTPPPYTVVLASFRARHLAGQP